MMRRENSLELRGARGSNESSSADINLDHLSEAERQHLCRVIAKDLKLRNLENQRLKRFETFLSGIAAPGPSNIPCTDSGFCAVCQSEFSYLVNSSRACDDCKKRICQSCTVRSTVPVKRTLCVVCIRKTGYQAMACKWFYDGVMKKFCEYGSRVLAKSIKGLDNVPDGQMTKILEDQFDLDSNVTMLKPVPSFNGRRYSSNLLNSVICTQIEEFVSLHQARHDCYVQQDKQCWPMINKRDRLAFRKEQVQQFQEEVVPKLEQLNKSVCITMERSYLAAGMDISQASEAALQEVAKAIETITGKTLDKLQVYLDMNASKLEDFRSVIGESNDANEESLENYMATALLNHVREDIKRQFAHEQKRGTSSTRNRISSKLLSPEITIERSESIDSHQNGNLTLADEASCNGGSNRRRQLSVSFADRIQESEESTRAISPGRVRNPNRRSTELILKVPSGGQEPSTSILRKSSSHSPLNGTRHSMDGSTAASPQEKVRRRPKLDLGKKSRSLEQHNGDPIEKSGLLPRANGDELGRLAIIERRPKSISRPDSIPATPHAVQ